MSDWRIRTVAVVGDGIAGWSVAAALRRRVPNLSVALVPVPGRRRGPADLTGAAMPSIGEFHRDIGLGERDVVLRTGAAFRLGMLFTGWSAESQVHAFGPAGVPIDAIPFPACWLRDPTVGPYHRYVAAAVLGLAGRFQPAGTDVLSGYAHGLQLDLVRYASFIEAYARHLGVVVTAGGLATAEMGPQGVAALQLADGSRLTADLYVDASGLDARLIGSLDAGWDDWSNWLPSNRAQARSSTVTPLLPPLERNDALADGWRSTTYLPGRTDVLRVDAAGADAVETPPEDDAVAVRFDQGRRTRAWIRNVVAVGEAHTVIEPLEAAPLHLLHTQIDRLIASLPDRDFADVETAHYNRETGQEADRIRDFLILRYLLSDRSDPFWRAVRQTPPPPLLAETLELFRHRGRLPVRDGESFDRDSWRSVLLGGGVRPDCADPLAARLDPIRVRQTMAAYRTRLREAVRAAPTHRDYLASLGAST